MRDLKLTNTIAIWIPLFFLAIGVFEEFFFLIAAYSTMLTGFLQVTIALIALYRNKKNIYIQIYLLLVLIFFLLWYYNENIHYTNSWVWPLLFTPLFLCIYISIIIYNLKNKS